MRILVILFFAMPYGVMFISSRVVLGRRPKWIKRSYTLYCGEMGRPVRSCDEEMSVVRFTSLSGVLRYTPDPNNFRVVVDPG
jgi:hypothetical protein